MFCEFVDKNGNSRVLRCRMDELPALIERMKREGWRRLYSVPQTIIRPGYSEAVEETARDEKRQQRKMAGERREAARDLADAVKEELR